MNIIPLVVFVIFASSANALSCYNCLNLQLNAQLKDYQKVSMIPLNLCHDPLSSSDTKVCQNEEQCLKVTKEVTIQGNQVKGTVRMCGSKEYCDSESCYVCNSHLCNAATSQYLSITVVIATLAAYFSVFY